MNTDNKLTINRRYPRSQQVLAAILTVVNKYILDQDQRDCYRELSNLIYNSGMEIITDEMRKEAGLPPRDEYGMTSLEHQAIEYHMICNMLKPIIVPLSNDGNIK